MMPRKSTSEVVPVELIERQIHVVRGQRIIIRTFVRMRRLLATPGELVTQLNELAATVQSHDEQIKVITDVLTRLVGPTPKRRIGFLSADPAS